MNIVKNILGGLALWIGFPLAWITIGWAMHASLSLPATLFIAAVVLFTLFVIIGGWDEV